MSIQLTSMQLRQCQTSLSKLSVESLNCLLLTIATYLRPPADQSSLIGNAANDISVIILPTFADGQEIYEGSK